MKNKHGLFSAIAMFVVAGVSLTSASYAWFSMSNDVSAVGMSVSITAPNNLLIKGTKDSEFSDIGTTDVDSVTIVPSSTSNATNFYVVAQNSGVNNETGALADNSKLEEGKSTSDTKVARQIAYVDFDYTIKTEGSVDVDVWVDKIELTNYETKKDDGTTQSSVKPVRFAIFEKNTTTSKLVGIYNAGVGTNHKGQVVSSLDDTQKAQLTDESYVDMTDNSTTKSNSKFVVSANSVVKDIIIRVWYEGQDTDCIATKAVSDGFRFDVQFASKSSNS